FIIGSALISVAILLIIGHLALRSYRSRVVSGAEYMIGQTGTVTETQGDMTYAEVQGELWKVRSHQPLRPGQKIRVVSIDGLVLAVDVVSSTSAPAVSRNL